MYKIEKINDNTLMILTPRGLKDNYELLIKGIPIKEIEELLSNVDNYWETYINGWIIKNEDNLIEKQGLKRGIDILYDENTKTLKNIKKSLDKNVYDYIIKNYYFAGIILLKDTLKDGYTYSSEFQKLLLKPFNTKQLLIIIEAYVNNMDIKQIKVFADLKFNDDQMYMMRQAFLNKLTIEQVLLYADHNMYYEEMWNNYYKIIKLL